MKALLRTRGGISYSELWRGRRNDSSPHTRRYFRRIRRVMAFDPLFSAHAEVFPIKAYNKGTPIALLRTRGGISAAIKAPYEKNLSSPHTRRYFPPWPVRLRCVALFSAHAEVFPPRLRQRGYCHPLLRTRGGISFPHWQSLLHPYFSAHAEVFLGKAMPWIDGESLLRTRGGISHCGALRSIMPASSPHTRRYFPGSLR